MIDVLTAMQPVPKLRCAVTARVSSPSTVWIMPASSSESGIPGHVGLSCPLSREAEGLENRT